MRFWPAPGIFISAASFCTRSRAGGLTTPFATTWDPSGQWTGGVLAMLGAVDVFFPNEVEATRIARLADPEAAARALADRGAEGRPDGGPIVVVKRGAA